MCERVCACARTRDTYAGIGHAGYRGHKYPLKTPKTASLRPKNGDIYIFYLFLFIWTPTVTMDTKNTIQHIFFLHTSTFSKLSVNNKDYYFYSLSIQEDLTTRPCGYPAECSRYLVSMSVTLSVTVSVIAVLLLLTFTKYPVRSLQESELARESRV